MAGTVRSIRHQVLASVRWQLWGMVGAIVLAGLAALGAGLPPERFLWDAAATQDLDLARQAIRWGEDVNGRGPHSATPLHWAAQTGNQAMVDLLLEHGADVTARDAIGATPLHHAAMQGQSQVAYLLIKAGADPNAADRLRWTPLNSAVWCGDDGASQLLLQAGAQVDLYAACGLGRADDVKRMLTADKDAARTTLGDGTTPLHWAATAEIARLLIVAGGEVDSPGSTGSASYWNNPDRPLHAAVRRGNLEVVRVLIEHGSILTYHNRDGETPLAIAIRLGHNEIAALLRERGVNR